MKLIFVGNIPHWEDAGVRLPAVAGGNGDEPGVIGTTGDGDGFGSGLNGFIKALREQLGLTETQIGQVLRDVGADFGDPGAGLLGLSFPFGDRVATWEGNRFRISNAPTPPAPRAAPSFGSTQAAQTQAEAFDREQAKLLADARLDELRRAEEQAEIDRELRLREARLATARDLVNIRSQEAQRARTQGTELAGSDPFRFLAVARGLQPPTGQTPSAGFKQNLLGAAQFEPPDLTGLDSNALQSVIEKLSQSITPTGGAGLGFAHGGTLSPAGAQGGTGAQAVPVGENGPEIMILRPDGSVEVVPLQRGAQGGATFDLGGFPDLFSRLRESVGVTGGARHRPPGGLGSPEHRLFRSRLGFLPDLGSVEETDAPFGAFAGPVSTIFPGQLEAFQFQGVDNARAEARRISKLIGFLPAPFKIPPTFFNSLLPAEKLALVSAYRLAGVPEADFRHLREAPQLSANPIGATAVG